MLHRNKESPLQRIYRRRIELNACRCSATVLNVGIQQEYNQLVISWIKFPFAIFMAALICFWFLQTVVNESEKDQVSLSCM